ncbi:hypothetical protein PBRA_008451 [Plasmodiophora brassicae]|uniref:Uncharacterized protein n=1 Tax=Plasmodiophora brassicae TaxID=37360 RepID=A0A0G4J1E9_PLABS|nr:hypothetical protein PBRA_008451 [Plasmodiophora brassicae]
MLEAAQYLQMGRLERYIEPMKYTCEDIAWIRRRETRLPMTTLERIVVGTPAYQMLRDADVTQYSIQRKEAIMEEIRSLLITGHGNIYLVNNGGFDGDFTALHWATTDNHPEVVELLLSIPGVIVTDFPRNPHDFVSPLQYAAHHGYTRLVELLLRFPDIEVDAGAGIGLGTALHLDAAKYDDDERSDGTGIVTLLIDHGADVDAVDGGGSTPLHYAAQYGRTDIVEELLKSGANINRQNKQGRTPLHEAANWNRAACNGR